MNEAWNQMFDREPPQLMLAYRPSSADHWLRGYARGYKGLPAAAPNEPGAAEAYNKGYAVGAGDRARAMQKGLRNGE